MLNEIRTAVEKLAEDSLNPVKNFDVAIEYEKIGQTASATSFFLRAAEYGVESHHDLAYVSLLRLGECLENQIDRSHSAKASYLQALSFDPNRPEAYFYLSRFYERNRNWNESYAMACAGLKAPATHKLYHMDIPQYMLLFQKAVAGWWLGQKDESLQILLKIRNESMVPEFRVATENNLAMMGYAEDVDPLEPVVTNYRKFFGKNAYTVIDIGTRDGDDAHYLANKLNSSVVMAIDASPKAAQLTAQKYPYMNVWHCAVSNYNGTVTFYELDSGYKELDGCSSIALKSDEPVQNAKRNEVVVPCYRMDSILGDDIMDVVKIDTEGFSWQVLDGFGDKLKNVKLLHVETERRPFHDDHRLIDEVTQFMKSKGFYLADISYEWGEGIQDQVWVNKSLAQYHTEVFNDSL